MSCPCCISTDTNAEKQAAARTSSIASSSIDKPLVDNINRDSTGRNKHSVDRYSSTKADTKVDNEHELTNMNFRKSGEVIETTMRRIRNDLILKRDRKSKLRKMSLQLKRKWMKETLEQTKMKRSHLYMMILWSESSRVVIVTNKKMSISQHRLDTFTSKQRVYSNDSDSRKNVTTTAMRINWKLNKRLRKSTLVITHHEELKELIAKTKHLADVATENRKCHEKIYKVYSDNQTSLKTVKAMISTKDQTRLQRVQITHESIWSWEITLKLHWVTKHAEVLKNEAMNKMIDDAHDLSLSLTERQRTEVTTRLTLIQKQIRQTWRIVWKERFNAAHFRYLTSEMTHRHLRLHKNHAKPHSALLTQLHMKKIDFNQFLHERRVLDVTTTTCECDRDRMSIKHVLLTCLRWKVERKAMQRGEKITNLRKLLETVSAATTIIRMILSTSILNQFQAVTSSKSQMKERGNRGGTGS